MDAKPHVHQLNIGKSHYDRFSRVKYGDQKKLLIRSGSPRTVARLARKVIVKHDRESQKAGRRETRKRDALQDVYTALETNREKQSYADSPAKDWPSASLKKAAQE